MNMRSTTLLLLGLCMAAPTINAQYRDQGLGGGIGFGGTFGHTDLNDNQVKFLARTFLRFPLAPSLQGEIGAGLGRVGASEYRAQIIPLDLRFVLSPFELQGWNPFVYGGGGVTRYEVEVVPASATPDAALKEWTLSVPVGAGAQFLLQRNVSFEMSGGYNFLFKDHLEAVTRADGPGGKNDAYWSFLLGLTVHGVSGNADTDNDGLTNNEEAELGTDPRTADTDGDGLTDGDEMKHYNTSPLKADSDGDGLGDGEEVGTTMTNPNLADTDKDGLSDGEEVKNTGTDPLKADTDGDGLGDGDEITTYHTNPLKSDSDGDGLADGPEVMKYHTDPLKADTDGGSVVDGIEVAAGTDPLLASDDVPAKDELVVDIGKAIALDGVVFTTGSATLGSESKEILEKAYTTLARNPSVVVEIRGHTDNSGKRSANLALSQARADAVRNYLIAKGIDATRLTAKGYGPDAPAASNATPEGRQKNRRIEFLRIQ